ncbi:MAG: AIR synthase-related protein, partial [Dehalococcoidia bacterium]|nr:AIR synthase-related protein [Dehalococcoidia bacterium]
ALTRSAAVPGDQVAITGYPGLSAAGLKMLKQKLSFDVETSRLLRQAHLKPTPRINEGQALLRHGVRAAIDISDGLIADLTHICKASKVSAKINKDSVPIHPVLQSNFKSDCQQLALSGGEDYELLFTASSQVINQVKQAISCPVTVIGEIIEETPGQVTLSDATGKNIPWEQGGWEHFKSQT